VAELRFLARGVNNHSGESDGKMNLKKSTLFI